MQGILNRYYTDKVNRLFNAQGFANELEVWKFVAGPSAPAQGSIVDYFHAAMTQTGLPAGSIDDRLKNYLRALTGAVGPLETSDLVARLVQGIN